jgi:hypothetical protein
VKAYLMFSSAWVKRVVASSLSIFRVRESILHWMSLLISLLSRSHLLLGLCSNLEHFGVARRSTLH